MQAQLDRAGEDQSPFEALAEINLPSLVKVVKLNLADSSYHFKKGNPTIFCVYPKNNKE